MKKIKVFIGVFSCMFIVCMVFSPTRFAFAALNGMTVSMTAVVPALFPFIFFTKLLFSVNADKAFSILLSKPMKAVFGVQKEAGFVFVVSLLSGYPVGSKSVYDLSQSSALSKTQAHRITSFCSNSGPMFLLGTVGGMFLKNALAGSIVITAHLVGSLINGLLFRSYIPKNGDGICSNLQSKTQDNSLQSIMFSTVTAALNICGFITLFFIVCEMLAFFNIDNLFAVNMGIITSIDASVWKGLLFGAFEVTRGCFELSQTSLSMQWKTVLCTLLASFGGMSIAFQSLSYLLKVKVGAAFYFCYKITHGLIAAIIALFLSMLLL